MINKAISNLPPRQTADVSSDNLLEVTVGEDGNYSSTKVTVESLCAQVLDNIDDVFNEPTITSPVVSGCLYFGPADVDGSWKFCPEGDVFKIERRVAGNWVYVAGFEGP